MEKISDASPFIEMLVWHHS